MEGVWAGAAHYLAARAPHRDAPLPTLALVHPPVFVPDSRAQSLDVFVANAPQGAGRRGLRLCALAWHGTGSEGVALLDASLELAPLRLGGSKASAAKPGEQAGAPSVAVARVTFPAGALRACAEAAPVLLCLMWDVPGALASARMTAAALRQQVVVMQSGAEANERMAHVCAAAPEFLHAASTLVVPGPAGKELLDLWSEGLLVVAQQQQAAQGGAAGGGDGDNDNQDDGTPPLRAAANNDDDDDDDDGNDGTPPLRACTGTANDNEDDGDDGPPHASSRSARAPRAGPADGPEAEADVLAACALWQQHFAFLVADFAALLQGCMELRPLHHAAAAAAAAAAATKLPQVASSSSSAAAAGPLSSAPGLDAAAAFHAAFALAGGAPPAAPSPPRHAPLPVLVDDMSSLTLVMGTLDVATALSSFLSQQQQEQEEEPSGAARSSPSPSASAAAQRSGRAPHATAAPSGGSGGGFPALTALVDAASEQLRQAVGHLRQRLDAVPFNMPAPPASGGAFSPACSTISASSFSSASILTSATAPAIWSPRHQHGAVPAPVARAMSSSLAKCTTATTALATSGRPSSGLAVAGQLAAGPGWLQALLHSSGTLPALAPAGVLQRGAATSWADAPAGAAGSLPVVPPPPASAAPLDTERTLARALALFSPAPPELEAAAALRPSPVPLPAPPLPELQLAAGQRSAEGAARPTSPPLPPGSSGAELGLRQRSPLAQPEHPHRDASRAAGSSGGARRALASLAGRAPEATTDDEEEEAWGRRPVTAWELLSAVARGFRDRGEEEAYLRHNQHVRTSTDVQMLVLHAVVVVLLLSFMLVRRREALLRDAHGAAGDAANGVAASPGMAGLLAVLLLAGLLSFVLGVVPDPALARWGVVGAPARAAVRTRLLVCAGAAEAAILALLTALGESAQPTLDQATSVLSIPLVYNAVAKPTLTMPYFKSTGLAYGVAALSIFPLCLHAALHGGAAGGAHPTATAAARAVLHALAAALLALLVSGVGDAALRLRWIASARPHAAARKGRRDD